MSKYWVSSFCIILTLPVILAVCCVLVAQWLGLQTFDQAVAGSTPGRGVIKSPRWTQPSIPRGYVNWVPALLAGVKARVCSLVPGSVMRLCHFSYAPCFSSETLTLCKSLTYLSITAVLVYTDLSDKHNTAASSSSDDDEESELSSAMLSKSTSPYLAFTVQQNHMHLFKILSDISRTTRLSSVCDCVSILSASYCHCQLSQWDGWLSLNF